MNRQFAINIVRGLRGNQLLKGRRPSVPFADRILLLGLKSNSNHALYSSSSTTGRKLIASLNSGPVDNPSDTVASSPKDDAKVAFYTMGRILRAILYTTLGLGTSAVAGFGGLHLWVENFELPPGDRGDSPSSDEREYYGWAEELEGWGAGYAGGGSHPGIGWRARALVRAAWVAVNWQTGQRALSRPDIESADDEWMIDAAFVIAENRLQQALLLAKQRGLRLEKDGQLDKGLIELELRHASICDRINTQMALNKACDIYERIWQACVSTIDKIGKEGKDCWESREGMRIANLLGDVTLKLATTDTSLDPLSTQQTRRSAEQYLIWSITQGLGLAVGDGAPFRQMSPTQDIPVVTKPGGILGFLTRSKPDSDPKLDALTSSQPFKAELTLLETTLDALNQLPSTKTAPSSFEKTISPPATRATILALTRLIVHLVSVDIHSAYSIQKRIHEFLNAMVAANVTDNSSDAVLHQNWLKTRAALSAVYLAELGSATKKMDDNSIVQLCQSTLASLDSVLAVEQYENEVFKLSRTRSTSGRLSQQTQQIRQEARTTAAMASNILGMKFETCPTNVTKGSPAWCGSQSGYLSAKAFFTRALQYTDSSDPTNRVLNDQKLDHLWNISREHLDRVDRKILPPASTSSTSDSPAL